MNLYKKNFGRQGEDLAAVFLEQNGLKVIGRNFRNRYGEIDLIAKDGDELVFCEVKSRASSEYGYPEQAVDWRKIRKINKVAEDYLRLKHIELFWRIDIISVEILSDGQPPKISWFKNVGIS